MADSSGQLSLGVILKAEEESSYPDQPSDVQLQGTGATGLHLLSENLKFTQERNEIGTLDAGAGMKEADVVAAAVGGDVKVLGSYNDISVPLCMALGFEHCDDSPAADASQYRHVLEIDNRLAREGWTTEDQRTPGAGWEAGDRKVREFAVAVSKQVSDWVYDGLMIESMNLSVSVSEVSWSFTTAGRIRRRVSYTPGSWGALSTVKTRLLFQDLTVSLGSTDGVTYGYAAIGISELELTLENNLETGHRDTNSGKYIIEPERSGPYTVTGRIRVPRYSSDDVFDVFAAGTDMKMKIAFGSGNYEVNLYLPKVHFTSAGAETTGPELRQCEYDFRAVVPDALTEDTNGFKSGAPDSWYSELGGIALRKNGSLVIIVVDDKSADVLTEV